MGGNLDLTELSGSQNNKYLTINEIFDEVDNALTEVHSITFDSGDGNALTLGEEDFRRHSIFIVNDDYSPPIPENVLTFPALKRGNFTIVNNGNNILRVQTSAQSGWPRPECTTKNAMTCFCDGTSIIRCNSEFFVPIYFHQPVNNKTEFRMHAPHTLWIRENNEESSGATHVASWEGGCETNPTGDVVFDVLVNGVSIGDVTFDSSGVMSTDLELTGFAKNIKLQIISPADIKGIGGVAITMVFTR